MASAVTSTFSPQGSKSGGMEEGGAAPPPPPAQTRPGGGASSGAGATPPGQQPAQASTKQWQGHPPPGGGGAGSKPPSSAPTRKISPTSQTPPPPSVRPRKSPTPEPAGHGGPLRTRKSPTPDPPSRVRKSPTPEPARTRKSPTPDRTRKSPSPAPPTRASPKRTIKSSVPSPKASPAKTKARKSSDPGPKQTDPSPKTEVAAETEAANDGSHYARPTIIEDGDEEGGEVVTASAASPDFSKEFSRSISEPPDPSQQLSVASSAQRKLSEGEGAGGGNLTGMFFQKLIQKEEAGGGVYQSNSSLGSQDSARSSLSRSSTSPRHSWSQTKASPSLSAREAGSTFSINKHKKVDLATFEQEAPAPPKKKEMRFSHGEDKAPDTAAFDSNMIKKAASVAHVEMFSKTVKQGTIKPGEKQDTAGERIRGKEVLALLAAGLGEDPYLKLTLTAKDHSFIARQLGVQLLGLGVLRSVETQDTAVKVSRAAQQLSRCHVSPSRGNCGYK